MSEGEVCYICTRDDREARVACGCHRMPVCSQCLQIAVRRVPTYRDGICPQCRSPLKGHIPPVRIVDLTMLLCIALLPLIPPIVLFLLDDPLGRRFLLLYATSILGVVGVAMCAAAAWRIDVEYLPSAMILLRLRPGWVVSFLV